MNYQDYNIPERENQESEPEPDGLWDTPLDLTAPPEAAKPKSSGPLTWERIMEWVAEWKAPEPAEPPLGEPPEEPGTRMEARSDTANAARFVREHGDHVRYCPGLGWLVWDGRRWAVDEVGAIQERAKMTARGMFEDAAAELSKASSAVAAVQAKALDMEAPEAEVKVAVQRIKAASKAATEALSWATKSQDAGRLAAMVKLAESDPAVVMLASQLDADPWLLNVHNGTVDLRTGEMRPADPADLLTKLAPVDYDPTATHPVFDRYLTDATAGDADFAAYLQRACGYTLTGKTTEEKFFLVLGPGGSGKSTLVEAMLALMGEGEYALKSSFADFLVTGNVGGATPELARLRGARLVAAVETSKGRQLNEVLVKELTGGDTITARHLYHEPISFKPKCKLWLAANESPRLTDTDTGLWRRLHRLPFEHELPKEKQNPKIKEAMTCEALPALLAWAVQGCLAWQSEGLGTCDKVSAKTAALRAEFDPLAEFFAACCAFIKQAETPAGELRQAYEAWAASVGARPIHDREWGKRLMARGCTRERTRREGGQITVWQGIGLLAEENLCTPCIPKPTFPELSQTEINASRGGIYGKRALGVHSVHSDSYYVNMADELAEGGAE